MRKWAGITSPVFLFIDYMRKVRYRESQFQSIKFNVMNSYLYAFYYDLIRLRGGTKEGKLRAKASVDEIFMLAY